MSSDSPEYTPPKLGEWLLQSFCSYDYLETALWDLDEIYTENRKKKGKLWADLLYLKEALSVVYYLYFKGKSQYSFNRIAMLKNNIIISLRGFRKDKAYSLLNMLGISSGLVIFLLISLYTAYEFSYDSHHEKGDRIYRVYKTVNGLEELYIDTGTPGPFGPAVKQEFPEVTHAARFSSYRNILMEANGEKFIEPKVFPTDPDVFEIFSLAPVNGQLADFLAGPNTVAISESVALKYFDKTDVVGEMVMFAEELPMRISGVFEDQPDNAHFDMDVLVHFESVNKAFNQNLANWNNNPYVTYLLTEKGTDALALEAKLPALREKFANDPLDEDGQQYTYFLEPLRDVHFSEFGRGLGTTTVDANRLHLFIVIAIAVLLMAGINYVNLATARAIVRMKESGLRKIIGARRVDLIRQFLVESGLLVFFSLGLAILGVVLILPAFASFVERPLAINFGSATSWSGLIALWLILTFLSGIYPALISTSFKPIVALNGRGLAGKRGDLFRNVLVVFQFTLSAVLIISALVLGQQLSFIDNLDTGYTRDQVLVLSTRDPAVDDQLPVYMDALRKVSGVSAVATSWSLPTNVTSNAEANWEGIEDAQRIPMYMVGVTHDFFDLYEIEVIEGRSFDPERKGDRRGMLLNQTAVKAFGWENPIGREMIVQGGLKREVIGVVKDFHIKSLREEIEPLQILLDKRYATLSVRVVGDINKALKGIEEVYESFSPVHPFSYRYFEDIYDRAYEDETKTAQITLCFTVLTIVIACLGLYGLAAHSVQQKVKELGVRKVMGASALNLMKLLSKDFLKLLIIAFVIAAPLAYCMMDGWLGDFAYHIEIGPLTFIITLGLMISAAMISVGYRTWRAAISNPVDSLRME
ncbi:MAG: FtsX-like permease family protein [Roseivirga sp.]|nr:FtsX-like permease family protein [Roseivirga sp.]